MTDIYAKYSPRNFKDNRLNYEIKKLTDLNRSGSMGKYSTSIFLGWIFSRTRPSLSVSKLLVFMYIFNRRNPHAVGRILFCIWIQQYILLLKLVGHEN